MAFVSLGMIEMVHSFNIRSEESIFKVGLFHNKYLVGAFIIGTIMQIGIVFIPSIANIFDLVTLTSTQWLYIAAISFAPIVIVELQKKLNEILFGRTVYEYKEARN